MAKTEILGIGELRTNFGKLRSDMATRTSRVMVVAAGGVLKKEAKSIIQSKGLVKSGAMLKNVAIKRETGTPMGVTQYNLGVRHGKNLTKKQRGKGSTLSVGASGRIVKRYVDDPFYWRFHELGTKHLPRQEFIAGALANKRQEAIDAMEERLLRELDKASKK